MQGAFLGALVSMSSTSIVVKCLNDKRQQSAVSTQITIATLVLQVGMRNVCSANNILCAARAKLGGRACTSTAPPTYNAFGLQDCTAGLLCMLAGVLPCEDGCAEYPGRIARFALACRTAWWGCYLPSCPSSPALRVSGTLYSTRYAPAKHGSKAWEAGGRALRCREQTLAPCLLGRLR